MSRELARKILNTLIALRYKPLAQHTVRSQVCGAALQEHAHAAGERLVQHAQRGARIVRMHRIAVGEVCVAGIVHQHTLHGSVRPFQTHHCQMMVGRHVVVRPHGNPVGRVHPAVHVQGTFATVHGSAHRLHVLCRCARGGLHLRVQKFGVLCVYCLQQRRKVAAGTRAAVVV